MNEFNFIQIAKASTDEAKAVSKTEASTDVPTAAETDAHTKTEVNATETSAQTEVKTEAAHSGGLSIQPSTIAFQALNFVVLLVLLNLVLYKPLTKLLNDREKKIREGVENADKAKLALEEADSRRQEMLKRANAESQSMLEKARKSGEVIKTGIVEEAHIEAGKIIKSGQHLVEMEKAKTVQELKTRSVQLVVKAVEKLLREKIDPQKDTKMIEESLNSSAA